MRNNNRITKPTIRIDIQLFTLHLIGICFHLNISLLNIDNSSHCWLHSAMPKRAWHCSRLHSNSTCLELLLPKWYSELKVVCTIIFKFYLFDLKVKHRSAFVIFTCIQVAARRRHVNARDSQDYFILQGLKDFGMRQTCPKNFWKNLRISVERDPFRMPLALTLQRKNHKHYIW